MVRTTVYHGSLSPALCVYVCRASERAFSLCTLFLIHWLCEKRMCVCIRVYDLYTISCGSLSPSVDAITALRQRMFWLHLMLNEINISHLVWIEQSNGERYEFFFLSFGSVTRSYFDTFVLLIVNRDTIALSDFYRASLVKCVLFSNWRKNDNKFCWSEILQRIRKFVVKKIGRSTIQTVSYHLNVLWALKWVCACLIHFNVWERQLNYTKLLYDAVDKHVKENKNTIKSTKREEKR